MTPDWTAAFREFCSYLKIDSKETGLTILAPNGQFGYASQERFLTEVSDGLANDVHNFVILKSRQIGISTISIALDLFWPMVHDGLQGAIITHNAAALQDFQSKMRLFLGRLPQRYTRGTPKFNRDRVEFTNGSVLNFMIAGTRAGGDLGRAFGLNYLHATEMSSWGDTEGLVALRNALAEYNPNRLYIFESTARGFNVFHDIWEDAEDDPTQHRFFLGWYMRQDQQVATDDARFAKYWGATIEDGKLTPEEQAKTLEVEETTGHTITPQQWCWHRWKMTSGGDENGLGQQEHPTLPDEAFIMTGKSFFSTLELTRRRKQEDKTLFKGYAYELGEDFLASQMHPAFRAKDIELRVFEEPHPNGIYVLGCDPTYGSSEKSNLGVIQVVRCYADRLVQVAEYAKPDVTTQQFAWIIAHLAGAYKDSKINLEINGPGEAVFDELKHLRRQLTMGKLQAKAKDAGLTDLFHHVSWYYYRRIDSLSHGLAYHFKTNTSLKMRVFNSLRDSFNLRTLDLHSVPLLDEMQYISYTDGSVGADGAKHDDRTMGLALAHVGWTDWVRTRMLGEGRTYEAECEAERNAANKENLVTYEKAIVANFFRQQAHDRQDQGRKWYD